MVTTSLRDITVRTKVSCEVAGGKGSNTMSERIAFLGIGLMGAPMAERLVAAGRDVVLWNRTRDKADAIKGARVAPTPAEAASNADVLITMLETGPVVEAVLFAENGAA